MTAMLDAAVVAAKPEKFIPDALANYCQNSSMAAYLSLALAGIQAWPVLLKIICRLQCSCTFLVR